MTFFGVAAGDRGGDLGVGERGGLDRRRVGVGGDGDVAAHLAVDLHRVLDGVVDEQRRVGVGDGT